MAPTSLEGQTLGKYRVLEPLGRGGMARVYRAYHPQLDRYLAIKVLRSDLVEEEEFLARFRREAQAVAGLRHPNIVQVFDFDVQDDVYYMVMEWLEGDTLKVRLNDYRVRDEQMPWGEAIRILLDVLDGLAYAHSEGMIHRDVKPANILLTKRGQAVISDFGIAHIVGATQHTAAGALMGTLNYIAPEQGLEGHSDARSDIYSLGIVLYEMLTQRTPFDADTPLAILMKHLRDPLPLPRQINPSIPEPFERIVLKALAKEPDDRYQNTEEMAQALREATEGAGIELPDCISFPLSFTTAEARSESVAIFSGTARERITDAEFATDDTDATLSERLAEQHASSSIEQQLGDTSHKPDSSETFSQASKELLSALQSLGTLAAAKAARALRGAVYTSARRLSKTTSKSKAALFEAPPVLGSDAQVATEEAGGALTQPHPESRLSPEEILEQPDRASRLAEPVPERRAGLGKAISIAIWIVVIPNLVLLWVAGLTGWWSIFEKGWPLELFLASLGFSFVMAALGSIWLLIPTGILLGSGIIFAYSSLTGNWHHWVFLWGIEVLVIFGTVWFTAYLARSDDHIRRTGRRLAWLLGLIAAGWSLFVPLFALISSG
jgi:serine/threonine protein kinase